MEELGEHFLRALWASESQCCQCTIASGLVESLVAGPGKAADFYHFAEHHRRGLAGGHAVRQFPDIPQNVCRSRVNEPQGKPVAKLLTYRLL